MKHRLTILMLFVLCGAGQTLMAHEKLSLTQDGLSYDITSDLFTLAPGESGESFAAECAENAAQNRLTFIKRFTYFSFNPAMKWLCFQVTNTTKKPIDFFLANQFPVADIALVDSRAPLLLRRSGYEIDSGAKNHSLFNAMEITAQPGENHYYVGLKAGRHPLAVALQLYPRRNFYQNEANHVTFMLTVLGAFTVLTLLNIFTALALRASSFSYPTLLAFAYMGLESVLSSVPNIMPSPWASWWIWSWPFWWAGLQIFYIKTVYAWFAEPLEGMPILSALLSFSLKISILYPLLHLVYPAMSDIAYTLFVSVAYFAPIPAGLLRRTRGESYHQIFVAGYLVGLAILFLFAAPLIGAGNYFLLLAKIRVSAVVIIGFFFSMEFNRSISLMRTTHQALRAGLKGFMAERHVDRIMQKEKIMAGEPTSQRMTVMFMELVGFSEASRTISAEASFMALKKNLDEIIAIIHKYDGVVDKSLSDGIICFFCHGYLGIGGENHEARALAAAVEIQRNNMAAAQGPQQPSSVLRFPLRIGINSDIICIGFIGDKNRFDIALSGEGVIMAKRYEAACEPGKILMGQSTFDGLPLDRQTTKQCCKRYVPVKHLKEVQVSYEFSADLN